MTRKTLEDLIKDKLNQPAPGKNLDLRGLKIESVKNFHNGIELRRKVQKEKKDLQKETIIKDEKQKKVTKLKEETCVLTKNELENVRILNLSHNNIQIFNFGILKNLPTIEILNLSHNKLRRIKNQENFTLNLVQLLLDNNKLKCIDRNNDVSLFSLLPKLERLDMSHNLIVDKVFADNFNTPFKLLTTLNLNGNKIKDFKDLDLCHFEKLHELTFDYGCFKTIDDYKDFASKNEKSYYMITQDEKTKKFLENSSASLTESQIRGSIEILNIKKMHEIITRFINEKNESNLNSILKCFLNNVENLANLHELIRISFWDDKIKFLDVLKNTSSFLTKHSLTCYDILLQAPNNVYDIKTLKEMIKNQKGNLEMTHKSFVALCQRSDIDTEFIATVLERFTFKKGSNETNENSSLSILLEKRNSENVNLKSTDFFFKYSFFKNFLVENPRKLNSFLAYKLNHTSFEALCERYNFPLTKFVLENKNIKFYHKSQSFDVCLQYCIRNANKSDFVGIPSKEIDGLEKQKDYLWDTFKLILDYIKENLKKASLFFVLIDYLLKYIELTVRENQHPEVTCFLINYLIELQINNDLKPILIRTILKVTSFDLFVENLLEVNLNVNKRSKHLPQQIKLYEHLKSVNENVLRLIVENCGNDKISRLFKHFIYTCEYINDDLNDQTSLDIIIQMTLAKTSYKETDDFTAVFIHDPLSMAELEKGKANESEKKRIEKSEFNKLLDLMKKRAKFLEQTNRNENEFLFSSTDLRFFFDELLLKNYNFHINFKSLEALCNRTDSIKDKTFLIEYLLSKIKYQPNRIRMSPVHYIVMRNMLNQINLKRLIERESSQFRFLLNSKSFKKICERKSLDLTKCVLERGDFVKGGRLSSIDVLLRETDYSNQFIRQLNSSSNLFNLVLNGKSLEHLFKRNDIKLIRKLLLDVDSKLKYQLKNYLKEWIEIFVRKENYEILEFVLEHLIGECTDSECGNFWLFDYIMLLFKQSIVDAKFRLADFLLLFGKELRIKHEYNKKACTSFGIFFQMAIKFVKEFGSNKEFRDFFNSIKFDTHQKVIEQNFKEYIQRMLNDKRITEFIDDSMRNVLNPEQNMLHFVAENFNFKDFKIYLGFFNNHKKLFYTLDQNSKSPLDLLIEEKGNAKQEVLISLMQELAFRLSGDRRLKMNFDTFEKVCEILENPKDWPILKIMIENTDFASISNKSILFLMQKSETFSNIFLKHLNTSSNLFDFEMSLEIFKSLCGRNDEDIFKLFTQEKRVTFGVFIEPLEQCIDILNNLEGKDLNRNLVEEFFHFLAKNYSNKRDLFKKINYAIQISINAKKQFKLAEYTLDYFDECVHQSPYPYKDIVNDELIDMDLLKIINDAKRWDLIEKILDCSNLSTKSEEKFCFTYFDFAIQQPQTKSSCLNCFYTQVPVNEDPEPIRDLKNHALVMFAESGQKRLKDHPTSRKLMHLKWNTVPKIIYWIVTILKFAYLIFFSIMANDQFFEFEKNTNQTKAFNTTITNKSALSYNVIRWPIIACLVFFELLNILYEIIEFWGERRSYFTSKKNWLELITIVLSILVYIYLIFRFDSIKNSILHILPICVLLKYITFVLCLEKMEIQSYWHWDLKFGIYIVAFGQAFKKSILLAPLIVLLLVGFILSFRLSNLATNKYFSDSTLFENVAKMGRLFLSNLPEKIDDLGMEKDLTLDLSNYLIFFMFIILVPILLINLLIGLATGELKYILDESAVMQYQLRLKYVLGLQDFFVNKKFFKSFEYFKEKFLYKVYTIEKSAQKRDINFIDKTEKNLEKSLIKLEMRQEEQYNLLVERLSHTNRDMQQNDKIQALQDDITDRLSQYERVLDTRLKESQENFQRQLDFIASDLLNKS